MIQKKVIRTIKECRMLKKNDTVVVGVSGGSDSTALLLLLCSLKSNFLLNIYVAHLNHMLRGSESDKDEEFVKKLTKDLDIPFIVKRKKVNLFAKKEKLSLEDAARYLRYEFFLKTARKVKAQKIAVGHTLDDQAETFIMRIIRGAGLNGLSSIRPIREMDGYFIIRPLLKIKREEILEYLKEKNITARFDSSNLSDCQLRNRIRLNVLPVLEKEYNSNIKEILAREAEVLNESYRYIEGEAKKNFNKIVQKRRNSISLDLKKLSKKDNCIIREILRQCIYYVKGDLNEIFYDHILNLQKLIKETHGTTFLHLPSNLKVVKEYDKLKIYRQKSNEKKCIKISLKLKVPGITTIRDLKLKIKSEIISRDLYRPKKDKMIECIDIDKINALITLRLRKPHDKFKPLGLKREKKIKDFFIDDKIPRNDRNNTLLAVSGGKIIWVVGHRISDDVKVTLQTKRVLRLTLMTKV